MVNAPPPELQNNVINDFAIEQTIEDLIAKIIAGTMTNAEESRYNDLLARRSRSMRPNYRALKVSLGR